MLLLIVQVDLEPNGKLHVIIELSGSASEGILFRTIIVDIIEFYRHCRLGVMCVNLAIWNFVAEQTSNISANTYTVYYDFITATPVLL